MGRSLYNGGWRGSSVTLLIAHAQEVLRPQTDLNPLIGWEARHLAQVVVQYAQTGEVELIESARAFRDAMQAVWNIAHKPAPDKPTNGSARDRLKYTRSARAKRAQEAQHAS